MMTKIFIVLSFIEKVFADPAPGPVVGTKEQRANHSCFLRNPWSPVEGGVAGRAARRPG